MAKNKRNRESHARVKTREHQSQITAREVEDVKERSSPRTPVIYEVVCRLGEEEWPGPAFSPWWSGVAAGLSIGLHYWPRRLCTCTLRDEPWRPLVADLV
jgi:hypothetical protein